MAKFRFLALFLFFSTIVSGQIVENTSKPIKKRYSRVSITNVIIQPTYKFYTKDYGKRKVFRASNHDPTPYHLAVVEGLSTMKMWDKFNDHKIYNPLLKIDFEIKGSGASYSEEPTMNSSNIAYISNKKANGPVVLTIKKALEKEITNEIVSKWWNRNLDGNFNSYLIMERAGYSALNRDINEAAMLEVDRNIEMISENLIDKTYIIVYNVVKVEENLTGGYLDGEGYKTAVDAFVYKLNFNDSVANYFYSQCWSDSTNINYDHIDNFDRARFPVEFVSAGRFTQKSKQPISNGHPYYLTHSRVSLSNLLNTMPGDIQFQVLKKYFADVEDIKLVSTIEKMSSESNEEQLYGLNMGTKEGLAVGQRFEAYEIMMDPVSGQQTKIKIGTIEITLVADNKFSNGKSELSQYRQLSGEELYPGVLLEEIN